MKNTVKNLAIVATVIFVFSFSGYAQLITAGGMTAQQLVQNILVGGGVTVSNVTSSGPANCLGSFYNGNSTNLGLDNGIVLSTGGYANIPNSKTYFLNNSLGGSGDPLLSTLSGGFTSYDAVVLEFDFVPLSNQVNFRYVFGSEEYPEYVCSNLCDAFGFFVSGPNPLGGNYTNSNIAIIPGTTLPVTTNSVNNGSVGPYGTVGACTSLAFPMYYVTNNGSTICFDGFTTPLTATVDVVPCQTYHIKIAISDIGDGAYDSGVFLEANSFQADAINLGSFYTNPSLGLNSIEGCTDGIISFTLNQPASQNITVTYTISGTAVNGIDYTTIPTFVVIPAGSDSVGIIINSLMDGLNEGTETVNLQVQTSQCGTEDITLNITDNFPVEATVTSDQTICDGQQPINFNVAAAGGTAPLTLNWSNGLGSNPNISISPPVGSQTYTVTATDVCGQTAIDNIVITVNPIPISTFTAQSPICAGLPSTVEYLGASFGGTFGWNLSGATILTGSPPSGNPFTVTWNTAGTYPITLTVISPDNCVSSTTTQYVQVLGAGTPNCCLFPTPDAGPNLFFCGLSGKFDAAPPDDPSYVGTWTQVTGPGITTYDDPHMDTTFMTVSLPGTYTYSWKEVNGPCDSTDFVTVVFIQNPIANAGPDTSVCGLTYSMQASMSTAGTGMWTGIGVSTPASTNSQVTVGAYGTYTYVWTETNNGCSDVDSVTITFLQVPLANAGPDATACGNRYTLSADSTFPGYWSGPNGVIYIDGYTEAETGILIPSYSGSSYTTSFTWYAQNGVCTDDDIIIITFFRPPHSEAGSGQDVCGVQTIMDADTIGSGIISAYWYALPSGPTIIPGPNPVDYNPTIDISAMGNSAFHYSVGEYWLYFVAENSQGCSSVDSTRITFYEIPDAHAGLDTAICGKSLNLNGNWSLDNPVGLWSPLTGNPGAVNFVQTTQPVSTATVTQYGTYHFIWKEMNAANTICYDRDTITIDFLIVPTPDAGMDFSVCGLFAEINSIATFPGGTWSGPSGVAFYDGINGNYDLSYKDSTTSYIRWPSQNDTITMYWSEFNGICYGYDSVNVYFSSIQPAIQLVDPADSLVCGLEYTLLNAQWPAYGSGHWLDTLQNTTFSPSANNPNPNATIQPQYYGWHHFYWITNNGVCTDTSEVVPVRFIEKPVANAGGNYWPGTFGAGSHIKTDTVCGLNYEMAAVPSIGTGIWNTPFLLAQFNFTGSTSSPIYNDSLYLNCNNCYSVFSGTAQYHQFVWQETNEICVNSDTLRLYFAPIPTGDFTATVPACRHYPFTSMITANTWPLPNNVNYGITEFQWQYPGGILTSSSNGNPLISPKIFVGWPWYTSEQHNVGLVTYNTWGCHSGIVNVIVYEPPIFNPSDSIVTTTCMQNNGEIHLSTANGNQPQYFTFNWIPSADYPNPTNISQTDLAPNSYHTVIVNGETLSPDTFGVMCHDTISYFVPDTASIIANAGGHYWPQLFGIGSEIKTDTVCGLSYVLNPGNLYGTWTTNALDIIINNDSVFANEATVLDNPSFRDLFWQVTNGTCTDSDTLRLFFAPKPTGLFSAISPACPNMQSDCWQLIANNSNQPQSNDFGLQHFYWSVIGSQQCDSTLSIDNDTLLIWWGINSSHNIGLTTMNQWNCLSDLSSSQLTEPMYGLINGNLFSSPVIGYSVYNLTLYKAAINMQFPVISLVPVNSNGQFSFTINEAGNYYLKSVQINPNSGIPFTNSYYNNVWEWANAQAVSLTCGDTLNINLQLYPYTPATGGTGQISGLVRYDGTNDPVPDVDVYLQYKPSNEPAVLVKTNSLGQYSISGIPTGNYRMTCEIPGLPQVTTHHLTVTPAQYIFTDVNFIVDSSYISKNYGFGIYADTTGYIDIGVHEIIADEYAYEIYPSPFKNSFSVKTMKNQKEELIIEIIDNIGRKKNSFYMNGLIQDKMEIDTRTWAPGVYFVKIISGNTILVRKMVKE